jgi:transcriptional regulator
MNERHKQVLELREQGVTFRAIGKLIGVSYGRAYQIYKIAKEKIQQADQWEFTDGQIAKAKLQPPLVINKIKTV